MLQRRINRSVAAAIFLIIAAAFLLMGCSKKSDYSLVLRNGKTDEEFARYPISEGETFTITFVHSVNLRPYSDMYKIENKSIFAEETRFYQFGAGVETELNEGEKIDIGEDGEIVISNIHTEIKHLSYIVGTVSDHVLTIGDEEISLRDLCGRNATVVFTCE